MAFPTILRNNLRLAQTLLRHNPPGFLRGPNNSSNAAPELDRKEVEVTFVKGNGERIKTKGKCGESLLDVVVNNSIDLDGYGACGAMLGSLHLLA